VGFQEQLNILITADTSGASQSIKGWSGTTQSEMSKVETAALASGTKAGTGFAANFSDNAKSAFTALQAVAAGFGAIQLVSFGKSSIEDAIAYQRASASLEAAIQGVGSAAGVTTTGVDDLSKQIQNQDAIFQGDVKSAATLLLTMDNIKNSAGG
jgi:predicted transcriptional regulator